MVYSVALRRRTGRERARVILALSLIFFNSDPLWIPIYGTGCAIKKRVDREWLMRLIHKFRTDKKFYLYNACTNHIVEVGKLIYDLVDLYGVISNKELVRRFSSIYEESMLEAAIKELGEQEKPEGLLYTDVPRRCSHFASSDEIKRQINSSLQQITLGVTEECNLRCKYCIYTGSYTGGRVHRRREMTFEVAKASIDYLATHCADSKPPLAVGFYGGEPLLNFELLRQIVHYCKSRIKKPLLFTLTTNGTLLDGEIIKFLRDNCFSLLVSMDGPQAVHDKHRRFHGSGKGSFDVVMGNLKKLKELDKDYFESMVILSMTLVPPVDLVAVERFVAEVGIKPRISLMQTYGSELLESHIVDKYLSPEESKNLMKRFANAAIDGTFMRRPLPEAYLFCRGLYWGGLKKLYVRRYFEGFDGGFTYTNLCIPGASKLFVTPDGRFYVCERVDGMSDLYIGDVETGVDIDKAVSLVQQFNKFRDETCKGCWVIRFCSMCFATTYHFNGWDKEKISHYCELHKREYTNALQIYCSILEENPTGLDFITEEEKLYEEASPC